MKKIILVLTLIGFVVCMRYFGYLSFGSSNCGTRMGSGMNNMMFGGMFMWIIIILFIVIIFTYTDNSNNKKRNKNIKKLDSRLVNGEISVEEYNEIRNRLGN